MNHMIRNIPEILAPAGSLDAVDAVLDAGADSVYVGGKLFGMRQHAAWLNFTREGLSEAIRRVHQAGRKIYVTVNNLLTGAELELAENFLEFLSHEKPDAIILQDLGGLRLCHAMRIEIPLHASTMMNVHDPETACFLKSQGISRIIASRDISLEEAVCIQQAAGMEVEVFLHGDMCIAQSGQCLTSGILSGESSNRGKCLKPCRWQYDLVALEAAPIPLATLQEGKYLLGRKDLSLLEYLPRVAASGIAALKIEGRARKPEYLHEVVSAYRMALDRWAEGNSEPLSQEALEEWREKRIRNQSSCYTFGHVQAESIDSAGDREPRIFSIAIEQREQPLSRMARIDQPLPDRKPLLTAHCENYATALAAAQSGADCVRLSMEAMRGFSGIQSKEFWHLARELGVSLGVFLPRILARNEWEMLPGFILACRKNGIQEIAVSSLGAAHLARSMDMPVVGDFSLNVFNRLSAAFLLEQNLRLVTLSLEATLDQAREIASHYPGKLEALAHGSLPGMISEHCVLNAALRPDSVRGECRDICASGEYGLMDPMGQVHPLRVDQDCRNHIHLPLDLCMLDLVPELACAGIGSLRIETAGLTSQAAGLTVECYSRAIDAAFRLESIDWDVDEAARQLRALSPRGFSHCAYEMHSAEISTPDESLPLNLWLTCGEREQSGAGLHQAEPGNQ